MKTSPFSLAALAGAVLLALSVARALAINVSESGVGDFPNSAAAVTPAFTYTLDVGSNQFDGQIPQGGSDADHFKVTVLPGRKITQINGFGSGITVPSGLPLYAGTYAIAVAPGQVLSDMNWTITFTVATAPDYEVTTIGGQVVLFDRSGFGDVLTLSEPFGNTIKFAAPGRTFSVDNGPYLTGDSGNFIPFNDISNPTTSVIVHAGAGHDTINVGAFSATTFPSLTINGGTGDDTVNFNGDLTFASGRSLDMDLQNDDATNPGVDTVNVAAGANLLTSGSPSSIRVHCSRNVALSSGASLEAQNGGITLQANQQPTPTPGDFIGIDISGATVSAPNNALAVYGRGGNAAGGAQVGVLVSGGGQINGAEVSVLGTGGAGGGQINRGVTVVDAGSRIAGDEVRVTGLGGGSGAASNDFNLGVSVLAGGVIGGAGTDLTVVEGTGGSGGFFNHGIEVAGAGSAISSGGGTFLTGTAGTGDSVGVYLAGAGVVSNSALGGQLAVVADSVAIDGTATVSSAGPGGLVSFEPVSPTTNIGIGSSDAAGSPATLGLTDAELDRVTTASLILRQLGTGNLTLSQPLTRATATDVHFHLGSGQVFAIPAGTDVSLSGGTLHLEATLSAVIAGTTVDTQYVQLNVAGKVNLLGKPLVLTPFGFTGAAGDTFRLIDNDGFGDAITGTFLGVPEGGSLLWPGTPTLNAQVTYQGDDGNDVVVTLVSALNVTNTADAGPGSLRGALASAANLPGADTITFAPALSGGTILLLTPIFVNDGGGVHIDASTLTGGITIDGDSDGNGLADDDLLFTVQLGNMSMTGVTLTRGFSASGGAIQNLDTLTLTRCTLSGNSVGLNDGGAIANYGTLTLTHCTLSGNSAGRGSAIFNVGAATLTHCTVSANSTGFTSGAIENNGILTLNRTLAAGNTPNNITGSNPFTGPENLTNGDPLLAPLDYYGGPTQTMALRPGSPALNAATGSPATADQRGFPIVGPPDIGAYEAGTLNNYNAWAWETLPATATPAQLAGDSDYELDGRLNVLEYATLTDGAAPTDGALPILTRNTAGTQASVTFPVRFGALDLIYELERSLPGIGPWVKIAQFDTFEGALTTTYVPGIIGFNSANDITILDTTITGQSKVFYRLKVRGL